MAIHETRCRCGAVQLTLSGEPVVQFYCHRDDCQAALGAAYVPSAIFPADAVKVTSGEPATNVIKATRRMRCGDCGVYLFAEIPSVGMRSVSGYLLADGAFTPRFHVQCQHAVLPVVDSLPHYKGFPPAFGGAEEFVAW